MRRLWTKCIVAAVVAIACLIVPALCWHSGVWSYTDYRVYEEVRRYAIGEDLWFERIRAGQSLKELVSAHPPHRTRQIGRYTVLNYYVVWPTPPGCVQMESLAVIAKDGRLVEANAGGCTWQRVFFAMSAESAAEFNRSLAQQQGQ